MRLSGKVVPAAAAPPSPPAAATAARLLPHPWLRCSSATCGPAATTGLGGVIGPPNGDDALWQWRVVGFLAPHPAAAVLATPLSFYRRRCIGLQGGSGIIASPPHAVAAAETAWRWLRLRLRRCPLLDNPCSAVLPYLFSVFSSLNNGLNLLSASCTGQTHAPFMQRSSLFLVW
jgi:hypothetical protein